MFRCYVTTKNAEAGFPRIRGDVPHRHDGSQRIYGFSPHTRGCSGIQASPGYSIGRFPRIRGDVLHPTTWLNGGEWFSPHTRGCSVSAGSPSTRRWVFPAYAGMFRRGSGRVWPAAGFPRIRGDVPPERPYGPAKLMFSPHTRGCSGQNATADFPLGVFPAYAGMFPRGLGSGR